MKAGIFIAHTGPRHGGLFVHGLGVIEVLLREPAFEAIVVLHSRDQAGHLAPLRARGGPLRFVEVGEARWKRFAFLASTLLGNMAELFWGDRRQGRLPRALEGLSRFLNPYRRLFERVGADFIHVPSQTSPAYGLAIPVLVTLHDLQELHFPEFFPPGERLRRALVYKRALERADGVIVSFPHVKEDLRTYFGLGEERVHVCTLPFGEDWFQAAAADPGEVRRKYGLPEGFLLYPAATWPHKNHLGLVRALGLAREGGHPFHLACTGAQTEFLPVIQAEVARLGLDSQVHFLGLVPEADLLGLYQGAALVVVPTLYEAGSGPVYEAMRFGTPVICSNVTSLPAAMGDPAFLFDPRDPVRLAALLVRGCQDPAFRRRNLENARTQRALLRSRDHGASFRAAYEATLARFNK